MEVPLNHLFFNPCFLINHQFLGITIYGNHHFSWASTWQVSTSMSPLQRATRRVPFSPLVDLGAVASPFATLVYNLGPGYTWI